MKATEMSRGSHSPRDLRLTDSCLKLWYHRMVHPIESARGCSVHFSAVVLQHHHIRHHHIRTHSDTIYSG